MDKNFYAKKGKKKFEFCPVFKNSSVSPKKKFHHEKIFGLNQLFDIERDLLSIKLIISLGNDKSLIQLATCVRLFPINFATLSWS